MDPDPGGPKTYGSYGSGSGFGSTTYDNIQRKIFELQFTVRHYAKDHQSKIPYKLE